MPAIDKLVSPNNRFAHSIMRFRSPINIPGWSIIFENLNIRGQIIQISNFSDFTGLTFAQAIEVILNNNIQSPGLTFVIHDTFNIYRHFIKIKGYDTMHIKGLNIILNSDFEIALTGTNDLTPEISDDVVTYTVRN